MKIRKSIHAISLGLVLLLLMGCNASRAAQAPTTTEVPTAAQAPTPTQAPTATLIPGIETPVDINGIQVKIVEVNFGKYLGSRVTDEKPITAGYAAKEGFRFAEVVVKVTQDDSMEAASEWAVTLKDSEGKSYTVGTHGYGVFYGDAGNVGWTFLLPENVSRLTLVFPGGVSVDLSPLVAK